MFYIVGLGNSGDKYQFTRHNAGFMVVEILKEAWNFDQWCFDSVTETFFSRGEILDKEVCLFKPKTFMNNSGNSILKLKKRGIEPQKTIVIHDEIDLPLGLIKISYNRGSGGHRGVESVINAFKTKEFFRFRVGISPVLASGLIKKPQGKESVHRFILSKFSDQEREEIEKAGLRSSEYIKIFITEGSEKAVSSCKG